MTKLGLLLLSFLAAGLIGCASQKKAAAPEETAAPVEIAAAGPVESQSTAWVSGVPSWYVNPPEDDDFVFGIGSAKLARSDRSRSAAEHRARTSLTFQLEALVDAMETDYYSESGTIKDAAVAEMFEAVDRQLASTVLRGAKIKERAIGDDGTVYALAVYNQVEAENAIKGVIESAASKNARIKSDAALRAMNAAFANKLSPPEPVVTGDE
ncbi:hypothetical protein AGMMS4952_12430 [Spirochaetia bacterium]|nr:hypothetical protein AGMMS4952_12430 [Spirochaetia bacterium]